MSLDFINGTQLSSDLVDIADAIRAKTGDSNSIPYTVGDPSNFVSAIESISGGGGDLDGTLDGTVTEITTNVTTLIPYALYGISSLTTLNASNVTTVGAYALQGCTNCSATLGSLKEVGSSGCRDISISGDLVLNHVSVDSYSFASTTLGKVLGSFKSALSDSQFRGSTLTEVHWNLPNIPTYMFYGCSNLMDIYLENLEGVVTVSSTNSLNGVPTTCTVHVPDFLLSAYQSDSTWNVYNLVGETTTRTIKNSMTTTGNGVIFTDIIPTANTGFECKFKKLSGFASGNNATAIFGRRNYDTNSEFTLSTRNNSSYQGACRIGNRTVDAKMIDDTTTEQIASYDSISLTYTAPDGSTSTISTPSFTSSVTRGICLFGLLDNNSATYQYGIMKGSGSTIYYLKIFTSGTLTNNLVPVTVTMGTVTLYAFYDTINDKYYQMIGETPTVD